MTQAVVFDLDGVLLQSEEVWDAVRERYVRERGGRYDEEVQRAMMGMSAPEWSRFLHEEAGVPDDPEAINRDVVARMLESYRHELPLLPGAAEAVRRTAAAFGIFCVRLIDAFGQDLADKIGAGEESVAISQKKSPAGP